MGDTQVVEEEGAIHGKEILTSQLRKLGTQEYLANRCHPEALYFK